MAKYVRTSKCLDRIIWNGEFYQLLPQHEEMLCCLLPAIQESTSLKKLQIEFPLMVRWSYVRFENMLKLTQSLRSLTLISPYGLSLPREEIFVDSVACGLKVNTTLRELTLEFSRGATNVSRILSSLREHPLLRRLCLRWRAEDLTGLETVLQSDNPKITELEINMTYIGAPSMGLTRVLHVLGRHPALTKLYIRGVRLGRAELRLLGMALSNIPILQSLDLVKNGIESAGLAELAPALYHNTSIKVLSMPENNLIDMESAELLREILRSNKTITTLNLSGNVFGLTNGTIECIADGLSFNSTLLKIDLSRCVLGDGGVSILAQTLGSRNTTLQELTLERDCITSTGVGVLLETMEHSSHITDLDLRYNSVWNEGASLLASSLRDNVLPKLTRLSLTNCGIGDDGFIALVSALEQNTSLLQLDMCNNDNVTERAFLALAESLREIKMLQQLDLSWCAGLASVMPLLLAGLRKNTSLFRFHVVGCAPSSVHQERKKRPEDLAAGYRKWNVWGTGIAFAL
jgi:Ran GTPase-activating protein (RanGAP) involved in mRNA processing and transport